MAGVRALEQGDYAYPLQVRGGDEVAEVTGTFDRMRKNLQKTHRELLDAERLATIGRMASSISHDLRHSLAAVMANAEFLCESNLTPGQREDLYAEIRIAVNQMTDLIESLLEFSRTRESLHPSYGDIRSAVDRAVQGVKAHPEFQRIRIRISAVPTAPVHQGYIEPQGCVARFDADGQSELWSSSQGHFVVRAYTAQLLNMNLGDLRVYPAEIGGAFGGKTVIYVEPVAVMLARKSGHPVKIVMSREDVFRATGPTSGSSMTVKIGVKRDGTIVAADGVFKLQAGAFPGSPFMGTCMCAFAPYEIANARAVGYDVVCNRPKVAAYRAPGSPIGAFAVESVLDVLAQKIGMDPLKLRLKNAAKAGTQMLSGAKLAHNGYAETIEALLNHPGYKAPLGKNQGRGVASGYWFNGGGESSATMHVNEDGTVVVATGSPDIGGSRASMAIMAAETLGIDYDLVRPIVADTASVGYTHLTGGSRVTFATGMAVVDVTNKVIQELCVRAAKLWKVDPEGVVWEDGCAKPASSNVGDFKPLSIREIAAKRAQTGGPIVAAAAVNPGAVAPGFATQFCDVEVDPETGKVTVLRFVAAQDVGRAIHPSYVEGQIQGGVTQGIGWALNEEYIYDSRGHMENPGFLDYRIPVASDLPMIEPVLVEVPNPGHPYGAKGVAEVNICPPMAAIANAIERAIGRRLTELPMSPPKVLAAIDARKQAR